MKGMFDHVQGSDGLYLETSNGWVRQLANLRGTAIENSFTTHVFRGTRNVDWSDFHTAKVDTGRITVKSDRKTLLYSGNDTGIARVYNRWYPMNKNLLYNNDENGEAENNTVVSVTSKQGMGDYFVMDFFDCVNPAGGTDQSILRWTAHSTLYWHEK